MLVLAVAEIVVPFAARRQLIEAFRCLARQCNGPHLLARLARTCASSAVAQLQARWRRARAGLGPAYFWMLDAEMLLRSLLLKKMLWALPSCSRRDHARACRVCAS